MLVAPNDDLTAHAVTLNPPTEENPDGYHRLIGGGVDLGETHHDAIVREVDEELGAAIRDLAFLATLENIFRIDGVLGHEIVFLYSGRLDPQPATRDATLRESDGSIVPVVWRPFDDADETLPLYPAEVVPWLRHLPERQDVAGEGCAPRPSPPIGLRGAHAPQAGTEVRGTPSRFGKDRGDPFKIRPSLMGAPGSRRGKRAAATRR